MYKRLHRNSLIITSTIIFLVIIVLQVIKIVQVAKVQEAIFNQSVKNALVSTAHKLSKQQTFCPSTIKKIKQKKETWTKPQSCASEIKKQEWQKVDSMVKADLKSYGILLDYSLDIKGSESKLNSKKLLKAIEKSSCYQQSLQEVLEGSDIELYINFPKKNIFIVSQLGPLFIVSILLIFFLFMAFIVMLKNYSREKENTLHMRDFINNMTHELKTPLTNIEFANNLIKKQFSGDEKHDNYVNIISDENQKLMHQVDDILSCLRSVRMIPGKDVFDLIKLLSDTTNEFSKIINLKGGKISFDPDSSIANICGNKEKLKIAIDNIVNNAINYSPEKLKITITTATYENSVDIYIEDKGIGILRKDYQNIFKQFYRVSQGDKHDTKGYGLGLYYAKNIIELYGGKIKVKSKIGEGTTFIISFPLLNPDEAEKCK